MIKLLLTGATGFLGSYLLESFVSQGFDVVVLKRSTSNIWRISHLISEIEMYNVDEVELVSDMILFVLGVKVITIIYINIDKYIYIDNHGK